MPDHQTRFHASIAAMENVNGTDYVVGDLHGRLDLLFEGLNQVGFSPDTDRLFCVGDLIDRGSDSLGCLELLAEPWFYSVLGNHEAMMLDALVGQDANAYLDWINNGGEWIREADADAVATLIRTYVQYLPLAIAIPFKGQSIGLIHAAVSSGQWGVFDQEADIWNRRIALNRHDPDAVIPKEAQVYGVDAVVVGHNVTPAPFVRGNTLSLDTGAAGGHHPTVWSLTRVLEALDHHQGTGKSQTFFGALTGNPVGHSLNDL